MSVRPDGIGDGGCFVVVERRRVVVSVLLVVALLAALAVALMFGEETLWPRQLVDVLSGGGTRGDRTLLLDLRANRVIVAALAGAALGVAGAVMQSVTRNPLASPDILGISAGASAGAVIVIVANDGVLDGKSWAAPVGAIVGGLVIAAGIAAFSVGMDPLRLVLAGIALSSLCGAIVTYLVAIADPEVAAHAYIWLSASLAGREAEHIWPVATALVPAIAVIVPLSRRASMLSLGAVRAHSLGVPVARTERGLLLVSVLLTSLATAATGPIGFVAFVAPQITARLTRTASPPLVVSGLTGATLVLCADAAARTILPWSAPIGAVTSALGAPILIYFLWRAVRV